MVLGLRGGQGRGEGVLVGGGRARLSLVVFGLLGGQSAPVGGGRDSLRGGQGLVVLGLCSGQGALVGGSRDGLCGGQGLVVLGLCSGQGALVGGSRGSLRGGQGLVDRALLLALMPLGFGLHESKQFGVLGRERGALGLDVVHAGLVRDAFVALLPLLRQLVENFDVLAGQSGVVLLELGGVRLNL